MSLKNREAINNKRKLRNSLIISIILILLSCFLLFRHFINNEYIKKINAGEYDSSLEKSLLFPNIPQSYIPHYNMANAAYERGDYDEAIHEYQVALGLFPTHPNECKIRINLALSLLKKIDFNDLTSESKVENAVKILLSAREYLTEENCANAEDDSGHNEESEELKKYIDELLSQLLSDSSNESDNSNNDQDSNDDNNQQHSSSGREDQIQQQLQQQMQEALQEQNQAQQDYESMTQDNSYGGKNW